MLNLGNFEENTEYNQLYNTIYHELCDTSVRDAKDEEYPQNLLNKLFDRSEDVVLPPDINGTLEYVLAEMLSPRECCAFGINNDAN